MRHTGGCQCGAVRFAVEGELGRPSICHCRMCQKAYAAPYAALVSVKVANLTWTRGEPARFASSNKVSRGFCSACGTTLTFEWSPHTIDLSICAFDEPGGVASQQYAPDAVLGRTYYRPTQHGAESRLVELWERLRSLLRGS